MERGFTSVPTETLGMRVRVPAELVQAWSLVPLIGGSLGASPTEQLQHQQRSHLKSQQEDSVSFDASEVEVLGLFTSA